MWVIAVLLAVQAFALAQLACDEDNTRGERGWACLLFIADVAAAVHVLA